MSIRLRRRLRSVCWLAPLCVAFACSRSGPETALEPAYRLERELLGGGKRNGPPSCKIGNELRPSIGCAQPMLLRNQRRTTDAEGRVAISLPLPVRQNRPRPLLVEVRCWPLQRAEEIETQVFYMPRGVPRIELDLETKVVPPDTELMVAVLAYEVPSQGKQWVTRPLAIAKGAVLDVGLALHAIGVLGGASAADFRLIARQEGGFERELLRREVTPAQSKAWIDERVDLSALAGKTVQFFFETRARPKAGSDPFRSFTLAVWGAPRILEPRRVDGRYDLVLISVDTLRGDFVGSEVNGRPLTPELDALAAEGASFKDVVTTYPSTAAAHMSLFTSTYPSVHGVTFPTHVLSPSIRTLPEVLSEHGFMTAAVTEGGMIATMSGFLRGFDSYREYSGAEVWTSERQVEKTFASGIEWVERNRDERFFLFLHTYQVHNPYTPPLEYALASGADGKQTQQDKLPKAAYKGEIRYTDAIVGELVEHLKRLGVLDRTIIAITSDHGEEFGEHEGIGHAITVYDEVMRVPLILWGPGAVPEGRVVHEPASLLDVVPTLVDLLGLPAIPGVQGQSLVPLLRGETPPDGRVRYAEGPARKNASGALLMARERDHKWIAHKSALADAEIYDLGSDPGEKQRLDDAGLRTRGEQLFGEFDALLKGGPQHPKPPERELDDETRGKLRALGYVE